MKKRIVSLLLIAAICLALCPNAPGDASRRALALGDVSSDLPEEWEEGSPDDPHGDEPGERDLPETKSFGPFCGAALAD